MAKKKVKDIIKDSEIECLFRTYLEWRLAPYTKKIEGVTGEDFDSYYYFPNRDRLIKNLQKIAHNEINTTVYDFIEQLDEIANNKIEEDEFREYKDKNNL